MNSITINIAKEYTKTPGGRYTKEGKFSGEDFRNKLLKPKYLEAIKSEMGLTVVLDGGYGYSPSFLEEAFGGLVRDLHDERILRIKIVSEEEPSQFDSIHKYITDALEDKK